RGMTTVAENAVLQKERDDVVAENAVLQKERDDVVAENAVLQKERDDVVAENAVLQKERDDGFCGEDFRSRPAVCRTIGNEVEGLCGNSHLLSVSCCLADKENSDVELCIDSICSSASDTLLFCEGLKRTDGGRLAFHSVCGASSRDSLVLGQLGGELKKDVDSYDVVMPVVGCPVRFSGKRKGVDREGHSVCSISSKGPFLYVANGAPLGVFRFQL
ncbi:hypothetical protein TcG_10124, partial [Trypanosoma cruzi]